MLILETFDAVTALSVFAFMMVAAGGGVAFHAMTLRRENSRG